MAIPRYSLLIAGAGRRRAGIGLANDALKRWLRRGGQPSELLRVARSFPRAQRALQQALAILL